MLKGDGTTYIRRGEDLSPSYYQVYFNAFQGESVEAKVGHREVNREVHRELHRIE